jgi:hypothetical protein
LRREQLRVPTSAMEPFRFWTPRINERKVSLWTSTRYIDTSKITHRRTEKCGESTTPPFGGTIKKNNRDESWISRRQAFGVANELTSILAGSASRAPGGGGRYLRVDL